MIGFLEHDVKVRQGQVFGQDFVTHSIALNQTFQFLEGGGGEREENDHINPETDNSPKQPSPSPLKPQIIKSRSPTVKANVVSIQRYSSTLNQCSTGGGFLKRSDKPTSDLKHGKKDWLPR